AKRPGRSAMQATRTEQVLMAPAPPEGSGSAEGAANGLRKGETPNTGAGAGAVVEGAGLDAAGWRMNLRNAVRQKDWGKGAEAFLTLLRLDRDPLRDHDVQNGARAVAVGLEDAGGEPSDKFFGA